MTSQCCKTQLCKHLLQTVSRCRQYGCFPLFPRRLHGCSCQILALVRMFQEDLKLLNDEDRYYLHLCFVTAGLFLLTCQAATQKQNFENLCYEMQM